MVGVMAIESSGGGVTVRVAEPWIEPKVAWTVVLPWVTLLARPALLIVATPVADELQVTSAVRLCELPLLNLPVATYCCVFPSGTFALAGVSVIEVKPVSLPVPVRTTRLGLPKAP